MDTNKMREQVESQFEAFFAEYEKKREANGWMPLEAHVLVHMRNAWIASREAVVVELPEPWAHYSIMGDANDPDMVQDHAAVVQAIEAQGLKVAP